MILQRKRGDMTAAIDALQRLIALAPEDGGNAAVLGQYLTDAGRASEAVALLKTYAAAAEPGLDVLMAQGVALARLAWRMALRSSGRSARLPVSTSW